MKEISGMMAMKGITAFVEPLESNALKALEALKEIQSGHATVILDGKKDTSLPVKEYIPGDIVEIRVGDKVPPDMRVLTLIRSTLRVAQGPLTGESEAVSKTVKPMSVRERNAWFLLELRSSMGIKCLGFPQNHLVLFGIQTQIRWKNVSSIVAQTQEQVQYLDQEQVLLWWFGSWVL
ncbi:calcium-transporting ATPase 1, endoplasmic reticulum-type-like [Silene latifolia]|uniref:calcium-transporting ATPase 1, endoplasmic reticulum-type-like n=1 Tax=Silene latifolia TaxID=37657 RepID=UPI003D778956